MVEGVIVPETLADEGYVRLWEAIMSQVAKDYLDVYISYLKGGEDSNQVLFHDYKIINAKKKIIELEDYIFGDLIAGPHAEYIIRKLRKQAEEHVSKNKKRRKAICRKIQ